MMTENPMLRPGREPGKTVDWKIVAIYLILVFFGIMNIYAAVHANQQEELLMFDNNAGKQFIWMIGAIALAILILFIFPSSTWQVMSIPFYAIVLTLLVVVIKVSADIKGSHSWFQIGSISFQPAELSKITTSLMLATFMSRPGFKLTNFKGLLTVALIIGVPMAAIVLESETGSALVYVGFLFVLYREGLSGWYVVMLGMAILLFILTLKTHWLVAVAVTAVVCTAYLFLTLKKCSYRKERRRTVIRSIIAFTAGVAMVFISEYAFNDILKPYQQKRIEILLGMLDDPSDKGYNVRQSMIAIGSGGLFGKGYLNGTQTTYGFVPEQSTDFIFCTVGEEWGFVGCLIVIVLYVLLITFLIEDAEQSREAFTRVYGYCVAACLFMHLFINIGMTIGLMPVIGIPLPLFSYGGSSLWGFTALIFIFLSLNRRERKYF